MRYAWMVAAWLGLSAAGLGALMARSYQAGAASAPPSTWPADSAVHREPGKPTLVMILHPECPCSRASVEELGRLLARRAGRVTASILFVRPPGTPEGWEK